MQIGQQLKAKVSQDHNLNLHAKLYKYKKTFQEQESKGNIKCLNEVSFPNDFADLMYISLPT